MGSYGLHRVIIRYINRACISKLPPAQGGKWVRIGPDTIGQHQVTNKCQFQLYILWHQESTHPLDSDLGPPLLLGYIHINLTLSGPTKPPAQLEEKAWPVHNIWVRCSQHHRRSRALSHCCSDIPGSSNDKY